MYWKNYYFTVFEFLEGYIHTFVAKFGKRCLNDVGAHPGGHQHGVSIQIPINLGKTFLWISRI